MIKKIISGLFILLIGIVNFSFADLSDNREYTLSSIGEYNISPVDGNLSFTITSNGNFATEKGGFLTNVLSFSSRSNGSLQYYIYLFWSSDQKPYYLINYKYRDDYYGGKWYKQGYLKKYFVCDGGYTTGFNINDCVGLDIDNIEYYSNMSSILGSIKSNDYFWYYVGQPTFENNSCVSTIPNFSSTICMGSSQLNKSICFSDTSSKIDGRFDSQPVPEDCKPIDWNNTTGSLDLLYNIDVLDFPSGYLGSSPGISGGGNIDGSSSIGENTNLTGNLMYSTCTNGYVLSQVSSYYGGIDNICYAGTYNTGIINDGVSFSPVSQGLNFKEVYNGSLNVTINGATPYYSSYLDWFNTWMYAMQKYKLGQIDFQVFNGQPVYLYAYFDRLYQNGVVPGQTDAYNIANICKLALFSDYSVEYKGTYFRDICDDLIYNPGNSSDVSTGEVGSIDDDLQEIIPPGFDIGTGDNSSSGTIISVDWSGTLSGNTNKNFDGKTFINEFYQKLQANFQKPTNDLTGIVPVYIYVFLIALILFRFLSH